VCAYNSYPCITSYIWCAVFKLPCNRNVLCFIIKVITFYFSFLETGVFGVPLENLLDRDQLRLPNANLVCPVFVDETCTFLENHGLNLEGILRVPGNSHRIKVFVKYIILYVVLCTIYEEGC